MWVLFLVPGSNVDILAEDFLDYSKVLLEQENEVLKGLFAVGSLDESVVANGSVFRRCWL